MKEFVRKHPILFWLFVVPTGVFGSVSLVKGVAETAAGKKS